MKRPVWLVVGRVLISLFIAGGIFISPVREARAGQPGARQNVKILESSDTSIRLEFSAASPTFLTVSEQGVTCQSASIGGLGSRDGLQGAPLPVLGVMLGIPPGASLQLQLLETTAESLPINGPLCGSRQPTLTRQPGNLAQRSVGEERLTAVAPAQEFQAAAPVTLSSRGSLRSQQFVQLRFTPLQYEPASQALHYTSKVVVELRFDLGQGQAAEMAFIDEGLFEQNLKSTLLNYEQAREWRSRPAALQASAVNPAQISPAYKIQVDQDGIYQLSYNDLQAAGLPVDSLDPQTFQLFNQSSEVAIYVEGEQDNSFEPNDFLLFYGQPVDSKYTRTNVYWLTWGAAAGARMQALDGTPSGAATVPAEFFTTRHFEFDSEYFAEEPNGLDKDHWYWTYVDAWSGPAEVNLQLDLHNLSTASHTASVRGLYNGYAGIPDHHVITSLNGNVLDDSIFPAGEEFSFSVNLPQAWLVEGANLLKVRCPLDGGRILDEVLINWFEIDYYDTYFAEGDRLFFEGDQAGTWEYRLDGFSQPELEAFDISDPAAPLMVSGANVENIANVYQLAFEHTIASEHFYLAQTKEQRLSPASIELDTASNWSSPNLGADYIIISHADFLAELYPLVAYRTSQLLRVQLVDVQDVYDEFNGGVFSPEAIKSFLATAYSSWQPPAPAMVLLVGDGNFDYQDFYGYGDTNFIPPYLDDVDPWTGETATDNRYVSVSGSDILPDLYIGRLPARTAAEAHTMVQKILDYEQNPPLGGWNANLTFVADEADSGGNFPFLSDVIAGTYVPPEYSVEKIYHDPVSNPAAAVRAAIQAAVNEGRLMVHYAGHASIMQWASENLLSVSHLAALTNAEKLPFFLPMTCSEGYFVWPTPTGLSSLGESIVRVNGGGAIASWSPAGYGLSSGHDHLDQSLMENLFDNDERQLGFLTTQAKIDLFNTTTGYNDLVETYILFGDPALNLQVLAQQQQETFLPYIAR